MKLFISFCLWFLTALIQQVLSQQLKLDGRFGDQGVYRLPEKSWMNDIPFKVLKSQGYFYHFVGVKHGIGDYRLAVLKIDEDGELDANFYDRGIHYTDFNLDHLDSLVFNRQTFEFYSIGDEKVLIATTSKSDLTNRVYPICFTLDFNGEVDSSFGHSGWFISGVDDGRRVGFGCPIQIAQDRSFVMVTNEVDSLRNLLNLYQIRKYSEFGQLDTSFGSGGRIELDSGWSTYDPRIAGYGDGGFVFGALTGDAALALFAFDKFGRPVSTFGDNGRLRLENVLKVLGNLNQIHIENGFIYLRCGGYNADPKKREDVMVKLRMDGSLVEDFGTAGILNISDASSNPVGINQSLFLNSWILNLGRKKSIGLYSSFCSKEGIFPMGDIPEWNLNYDSLKFSPYASAYFWIDNELYVVGKFLDASQRSDNRVVLNFKLDTLTATEHSIDEVNLLMSPNPVGDELYLSSDMEEELTALIVSSMGVKMMQSNLESGSGTLDLSSLMPGVYFLQVLDRQNRRIGYRSFIKK